MECSIVVEEYCDQMCLKFIDNCKERSTGVMAFKITDITSLALSVIEEKHISHYLVWVFLEMKKFDTASKKYLHKLEYYLYIIL